MECDYGTVEYDYLTAYCDSGTVECDYEMVQFDYGACNVIMGHIK